RRHAELLWHDESCRSSSAGILNGDECTGDGSLLGQQHIVGPNSATCPNSLYDDIPLAKRLPDSRVDRSNVMAQTDEENIYLVRPLQHHAQAIERQSRRAINVP